MIDDMKRRLADLDRQLKTKKHLEHFKNLLMKKKLKIKFWKTEKALAMQILEQEGLPERKTYGRVQMGTCPMLYEEVIGLQGCRKKYDWFIGSILFDSNEDRDAYLDKITNAITDELFTGKGELEVDEMCEVSKNPEYGWHKAMYAGTLDEKFKVVRNHLTYFNSEHKDLLCSWEYARPLPKRTEPKVEDNGEVITYNWEAE